MEFFLLPLLLLAGLVTLFDGGGDGGDDGGTKGGGDNGTAGDDTLEGTGLDTIYGFGGDDLISLTDEAVGNGGAGNDTLTATDDAQAYGNEGDDDLTLNNDALGFGGDGNDEIAAFDQTVGYGLDGDDILRGSDNATVNGGIGNDTLYAFEEAAAYGGEGADVLFADGDGVALGGDGRDTLTGGDDARVYGGQGADVIYMDETTTSTGIADGGWGNDRIEVSGDAVVTGGEGRDRFIADLTDTATTDGEATLDIQDFVTGEDRIAVILGDRDISDISFTSRFDATANATIVEMTEAGPEGETQFARFTLRGVTSFDLNDMTVYGNEFGDDRGWAPPVNYNDTLAGDGNDSVNGGIGNDRITLEDNAIGNAGEGNDTLIVSDNAQGFGLNGNDVLTGSDNATIMGGDGNDVLTASGTGEANGGWGDDEMTLSGDVDGFAGVGNDTITALDTVNVNGGDGDDSMTGSGQAVMNGGDGADTLIGASFNTLSGGDGNDLFVSDWDANGASVTVRDFDPDQDSLAVMIGDRDPADLEFRVMPSASGNATDVVVFEAGTTDEVPYASFTLRGVDGYDLNDLLLYGEDLDEPLEFTIDPALIETITGGAGGDRITLNDSQTGLGLGGNDVLIANDQSEAYGGDGNDSITASDISQAYGGDGDDTLFSAGDVQSVLHPSLDGGNGNDVLSGIGELHGGAGNDLLTPNATGSLFNGSDSYDGAVYGEDGDDTIRGDSGAFQVTNSIPIYGGAGNDLIMMDVLNGPAGAINAGSGNDVVIVGSQTGGGIITLGGGADVLALDVLDVDPSEFMNLAAAHRITDFNPATDQLALIAPEATIDAPVFISWNATTNVTTISLSEYFRLELAGVNGETTPIGIDFYASQAALTAGTPFRSV